MRKLVIVGGGASGMTAAISAAQEAVKSSEPLSVQILEQKDAVGKKILATGNGCCNLSNENMQASCYSSDTPEAVGEVLDAFGVRQTLDFFRDLGIMTRSRDGYLYPRSGQAQTVRDALRLKMAELGVDILTDRRVTGIEKTGTGFEIRTEQNKGGQKQGRKKSPAKGSTSADAVILSAGGRAAPKFGSDGSGYELAGSLGHTLSTVVPALVQLRMGPHPLRQVSGVRTIARVTALVDGCPVAEDTGEVQMTGYGLSGIPVFQISRHIAKALASGKETAAAVDFLPEMEERELEDFLLARRDSFRTDTAAEYLEGIFNRRLSPALLEMAGIRMREKAGDISDAKVRKLALACKKAVVPIEDTNGFEYAQVCAGGVHLDEIRTDTMESKCCPGLYLTGELLDADGICGGYNLQWAWATGWIAGEAAAQALLQREGDAS